jgi:hypothetical protein
VWCMVFAGYFGLVCGLCGVVSFGMCGVFVRLSCETERD